MWIRIRNPESFYPGSGIRGRKIRIWDKYPGIAALVSTGVPPSGNWQLVKIHCVPYQEARFRCLIAVTIILWIFLVYSGTLSSMTNIYPPTSASRSHLSCTYVGKRSSWSRSQKRETVLQLVRPALRRIQRLTSGPGQSAGFPTAFSIQVPWPWLRF